MSFYYVDDIGTADGTDNGRYASQQTGAMTALGIANYYSSILAANSAPTSPVSGDVVFCSDTHLKLYGIATNLGCIDGVWYISVDALNIENEKEGATEETSGGSYTLTIMATVSLSEVYTTGIFFKTQGSMIVQGNVDNRFVMDGGGLEMTSTNATNIQFGRTGLVFLKNCTITFGGVSQYIEGRYGVNTFFDNVTTAGAACTILFKTLLDGMNVKIENSNMTSLDPSVNVVDTNDGVWIDIQRSLFPATPTWVSGSFDARRSSQVRIRSVGLGTGTDNKDYYYTSPVYLGHSEQDKVIFKTSSPVPYSTKIVTESTARQSDPERVLISQIPIKVTDYTTTVNIKVDFMRDGSLVELKSDEVWAEAVYVDGDNNAYGSKVSNAAAPLATGVSPTIETGKWTGGTPANNIEMSMVLPPITIGSSAGNIADGVVEVYFYSAVPGLTVNFHVIPEFS
ncbi:hypothetical protein COB55_03210 [Candidatus Wolfebacteria bacterium]|nr:MAG: hypothetical protein COB55_03210 [Candidatus Wolfebacteria bacterium]